MAQVGTYLANMTKFATVAAKGNTTILNKTSGGESLQVLSSVFRPSLGHLCATRLVRKLDGEHELALRVADHVNDRHVEGDLLLLGNQEYRKSIVTERSLDIGEAEVVHDGASIGLEAGAESVKILLLGCVDELRPSLLSFNFRNTSPVDKATLLTLQSFMTVPATKLALHRVGRAASGLVAFDTARIAGTSEFAFDACVGAVGLVVSNFAAVVALASEVASSGLVGALTSEVASLVAAVRVVSLVKQR